MNDREIFEDWIKSDHPSLWPNPHEDGTHYDQNGYYYNRNLQNMWEAWQQAILSVIAGVLT